MKKFEDLRIGDWFINAAEELCLKTWTENDSDEYNAFNFVYWYPFIAEAAEEFQETTDRIAVATLADYID